MTKHELTTDETFKWADIKRVETHRGTNINNGVTMLHMFNGDIKEVPTTSYRYWAWLFACINPSATHFQLVRCDITGSFATGDKSINSLINTIVGWKIVDGHILPVINGTKRSVVSPGKPYAVLNTKNRKVRIIGGGWTDLREFKSLGEFERITALQAGIDQN